MSALIEIARTLKGKSKEKPFNMDIILCAFNGEEEALRGSKAFVSNIKSKSLYRNLYNINIDCIGAKEGGKLDLKNKSNVSNKLYEAVKATMKKDNIAFGTTGIRGTSDHQSFENESIPNVFIAQEGIEKLVHKPTDTPDTLDYEQIYRIAKAISDFVQINDGVTFN